MVANIKQLKIDMKGLILTLFMGVITQGVFNLVFFSSIGRIGVINGTILLYLAPIFITFFSVVIFKEKLTVLKQFGVGLSIIGSILALTGAVFDFKELSAIGILLGVASGLGYSLVSVFSKIGLKRYHAKTLIFYSFTFGALFIFPLVDLGEITLKMLGAKVILSTLGLGIFSATVAYIFYFEGIATGIDLSKVGVMSMIELIFAIVFAVLFVGETLNPVKIFGIGLILFAIYLINKKGDSKND
jgi:drug/metabolite transporter (DMT)-like permease